MSEGEDRHFCARASSLHITLLADSWPDIYHAYHPQEYEQISDSVADLERSQTRQPRFGDLISAKIEVIEPVADETGRPFLLGPKWVRGKLGSLAVLPEIEEALGSMEIGGQKLIKLHYPSHFELPQLQLQTRIVRLSLLDCKPFRLPPVIDREMFVGSKTGKVIDHTTLTGDQLNDISRE